MTQDLSELYALSPQDLCLFLDFDGTLVDLAATPDAVIVPDALPGVLAALHERLDGRLYLVSGREVKTLAGFLPDFAGDIFGAHGAEARRGGVLEPHPVAGQPVVAQVHAAARDAVAAMSGTLLETKDTGAVIHYRGAPEAEAAALEAANRIVTEAKGMELHRSKMAFEIRPDDAGKAGAVTRIMDNMPDHIRPVVIGDDVTDEEAMVVANARNGVAIRVGDGDTCAAWRLPTPADVVALLDHWAGKDAA